MPCPRHNPQSQATRRSGRVALGGYPPRAPTNRDVQVSRIRLLNTVLLRTDRHCGRSGSAAAGNAAITVGTVPRPSWLALTAGSASSATHVPPHGGSGLGHGVSGDAEYAIAPRSPRGHRCSSGHWPCRRWRTVSMRPSADETAGRVLRRTMGLPFRTPPSTGESQHVETPNHGPVDGSGPRGLRNSPFGSSLGATSGRTGRTACQALPGPFARRFAGEDDDRVVRVTDHECLRPQAGTIRANHVSRTSCR